MDKKGQMTMWIILSAVLVASIVLFFLVDNIVTVNSNNVVAPEQYIDKCIRDAANEAISKMLPHGGFVNPRDTKKYNDIDIAYLCKNIGNYLPCVNQHPMLINEMRKEILDYIRPNVEQCITEYKDEMEKRNFDVSIGEINLSVDLVSNRAYVNLNNPISLAKDGKTSNYNNLRIEVMTPAYNLANVALEIVNQESKYCYFEYQGYTILYPRFDIRKFVLSDSTKIYTIQDINSGKKMNIAIRGCAIPAGI